LERIGSFQIRGTGWLWVDTSLDHHRILAKTAKITFVPKIAEARWSRSPITRKVRGPGISGHSEGQFPAKFKTVGREICREADAIQRGTDRGRVKASRIRGSAGWAKTPLFISITAGPKGSSIYFNGKPARVFPGCVLSGRDLSGQLIFGTSPFWKTNLARRVERAGDLRRGTVTGACSGTLSEVDGRSHSEPLLNATQGNFAMAVG
jgi:hypothetical protein